MHNILAMYIFIKFWKIPHMTITHKAIFNFMSITEHLGITFLQPPVFALRRKMEKVGSTDMSVDKQIGL